MDKNTLSPLLERYFDYKLIVQERSEKTVSEYRLDLQTFFKFVIAERSGIDVNSEDIDGISLAGVDEELAGSITSREILSFLVFEKNVRGNQAGARARKLSAIKSFFRFASVHEHILEKDPSVDIETPKLKKALPKFLSEAECLDLLESIASDTASKTRLRDYCMVTLFLNCGMRLSELVGINLSDIDREMRYVRVLGKGNKERIVYLNDACRASIGDYLKLRAAQSDKIVDKNALFLSSRGGKRIGNSMVQKVVEKYLALAGLEYKNYSVHKLRHTAATLMYRQGGVDVLTLKEILGHEQLSTTQIYTHVSNEAVEAAAGKNPLASVTKENVVKNQDPDEEDENP